MGPPTRPTGTLTETSSNLKRVNFEMQIRRPAINVVGTLLPSKYVLMPASGTFTFARSPEVIGFSA